MIKRVSEHPLPEYLEVLDDLVESLSRSYTPPEEHRDDKEILRSKDYRIYSRAKFSERILCKMWEISQQNMWNSDKYKQFSLW